jgi:hypothetical protein
MWARGCRTKLENAHGTEFRKLLYIASVVCLRVGVHAAVNKLDGMILRSSLTSSHVDHWLEVPAWMFDRATVSVCGHVDLAALTTLAALLRQALNDGRATIGFCAV